MTLPASGQISFNDLRVELGISSQAPFSITTAATNGYVTINTNSPSYPNSSTPHAISEWYSYNHNAAPPCTPGSTYCDGTTVYQYQGDCSVVPICFDAQECGGSTPCV
jgi:hypothetical protein